MLTYLSGIRCRCAKQPEVDFFRRTFEHVMGGIRTMLARLLPLFAAGKSELSGSVAYGGMERSRSDCPDISGTEGRHKRMGGHAGEVFDAR